MFCKLFSESPHAYLGSTAAAVQPNERPVELSENNLHDLFHNRTPQSVDVQIDSKYHLEYICIMIRFNVKVLHIECLKK